MPRVSRNIFINAPVEKAFSYVADPINSPVWVPGVVAVRGVVGKGAGTSFSWTYKMWGISIDGQSTFMDYVPNEKIVMRSEKGIISVWTYHCVR